MPDRHFSMHALLQPNYTQQAILRKRLHRALACFQGGENDFLSQQFVA